MAVDLGKLGTTSIRTLAVHPGSLATKMTGYYGEDDMETCISSLVGVIERFGTEAGNDLPNGGYVRWSGQVIPY
jgi:NAD(P)-dependent dehydrogenase (short-subunit alcohol dehydrogenase family)